MMLQLATLLSGNVHGPATVWLLGIEGLNFNPFTPNRPSIPDACERTIGWGPHETETRIFDTRMRQVMELCNAEFEQHVLEAEDLMIGVYLEDNPVVNSQHEEKYYQRIALKLGALWRRTVDLDHLRALVMYVVFARIYFLQSALPQSAILADRSAIAFDAHILLCRFLQYKARFGRPTENIFSWSNREICRQRHLAAERKQQARGFESSLTESRFGFSEDQD